MADEATTETPAAPPAEAPAPAPTPPPAAEPPKPPADTSMAALVDEVVRTRGELTALRAESEAAATTHATTVAGLNEQIATLTAERDEAVAKAGGATGELEELRTKTRKQGQEISGLRESLDEALAMNRALSQGKMK